MSNIQQKITVFWFRRDLRIDDNHGFYKALQSGNAVLPIFIFDTTILNRLENSYDLRVDYIHQAVIELNKSFSEYGSVLQIGYGTPLQVFEELVNTYTIHEVITNHDYEPEAIQRDEEAALFLKSKNILFSTYKDQVVFEKHEILKSDTTPYTVFTPYSKKWKILLNEKPVCLYESEKLLSNLCKTVPSEILSLEKIGFEKTAIQYTIPVFDKTIIDTYDQYRDYPSLDHTTHLGVALRFGTISIRKCVQFALKHNEIWLNELIWREFFMQILFHFPKVVHHCFKEKYERIPWKNNEAEFERWCQGKTGYPIVDAGMRELNETGFMHNRVRMITASFLCKHLLIDWRWGEAYFAQKLLDYDLSANNGNWQWAAGCGCDAAPYFRIFNPEEQTKKFDKQLHYIKKWVAEFGTEHYMEPMIDHRQARERALEVYKKALLNN